MLEAEGDIGTKLEVGSKAAQAPDNLAGGAVDLVDGAGIPSRDQVVASSIFVDRVDVEVVPCIRRVISSSCLTRVQRENGL